MKLREWIGAWIVLVCVSSGAAQTPEMVKRWTFGLPHGTLAIELQSGAEGASSLRIGPNGESAEAPMAEQVESLKEVLREMPSLGWDPHKLAGVSTRLFGTDVRTKLAYACVDSRAWHMSMHNKGKDEEKIVAELLNQTGVYEPYNEAFHEYGIRVQVSGTSKVALIHFGAFPPRNFRDRSYGRVKVPADALVEMKFAAAEPATE